MGENNKKKDSIFVKNLLKQYINDNTSHLGRLKILEQLEQLIVSKKSFKLLSESVINGKNGLGTLASTRFVEDYPSLSRALVSFFKAIIEGNLKGVKLYSKYKLNRAVDKEQNTLIHYAAASKNLSLVILLMDSGASLDICNISGKQAIHLTKCPDIQSLFIEKLDSNISGISLEKGVKSLKEHKRELKTKIINSSAIRPKNLQESYAPHVLLQHIFVENKNLNVFIAEELSRLYESSNFFKQMINFLALASLAKIGQSIEYDNYLQKIKESTEYINDNPNLDGDLMALLTDFISSPPPSVKNYKAVIIDAENMSSLDTIYKNALGYYCHNHTVYVASSGVSPKEMVMCFLHESMHYVIHQSFKNKSRPYCDNHASKSTQENLLKNLYKFIHNFSAANDEEIKIYERFSRITSGSYSSEHQDTEIFVSFVEVMYLLGPEKGGIWLERNMPDLYAYFKDVVIDKMTLMLNHYDVDNYLTDKAPFFLQTGVAKLVKSKSKSKPELKSESESKSDKQQVIYNDMILDYDDLPGTSCCSIL